MKKQDLTSDVTAQLLEVFAVRGVKSDRPDFSDINISDEDYDHVMRLYNEITAVFEKDKTDVFTMLKVVSAYADALSLYITAYPLQEQAPGGAE